MGKVVDADVHVFEAHDVWVERIDAKRWGDAIPRYVPVAVAARVFLEITVGWSLMFAAAGDRTIIPDAGELDVRVDVFPSAY